MIILVDMDGVLADFEQGFINLWQETHPAHTVINREKRNTFSVKESYPEHLHQHVEAIYSNPGFFHKLPVIEGAKEALEEIESLGHDVWICTAPLTKYDNCVLKKYHWVAENLGSAYTKRIILTKDKTMVRGDFLIDDRPDIVGNYNPKWEHIIYDASYNQDISDRKRITWQNWHNVLLPLLKSDT